MNDRDLTSGFLLTDKESEMTSHDVVGLFRRRTRTKKVGHAGTLDPAATGLLVLCVDKATRLQSLLMGMPKTYEGVIQFGWATDTYDAEGSAIGEPVAVDVDADALARAITSFRGEIEQVPPAYSAIKVDGQRAYDLARKGETPVLKSRKVTIYDFEILAVEGSRATFRLRCSAGTYVRSIAHDLGRQLGLGGHLKSLRRTSIGELHVDQALSTARLREMGTDEILASPHFRPMCAADLPLAAALLDPAQEQRMLHGQSIITKLGGVVERGEMVAVSNLRDELVAIASVVNVLSEGGLVELQPKIVLK